MERRCFVSNNYFKYNCHCKTKNNHIHEKNIVAQIWLNVCETFQTAASVYVLINFEITCFTGWNAELFCFRARVLAVYRHVCFSVKKLPKFGGGLKFSYCLSRACRTETRTVNIKAHFRKQNKYFPSQCLCVCVCVLPIVYYE